MAMLLGQTLKDRYQVFDQLGAGGAATVYLATDQETGQTVTVKMMHPHLIDEEYAGRFAREIDLLQQIDSPFVIKLYDWAVREFFPDLHQALSYIVAEYVEGHALSDIIDTRAPLGEPDSLAIARQIAHGLAAIHKLGIIHRDVKAQNIMITPDNHAKLIDFGIAKGKDHATLTDPMHFAGTLYYAPPEQILESRTVDHRADIYALGVVMYEMLTGTLPVKAREFGTVASRIISGNLDPIVGVSKPVEDLVTRMLAHRVETRLGSAEEVIRRIDTIIGVDEPITVPRPPSPASAAQPPVTSQTVAVAHRPTISALLAISALDEPVALLDPQVIVGRSHPRHTFVPDVDLWALGVEQARTVSRRHCRISSHGVSFFVEDLGSMNGTRLNDRPIEPGRTYGLSDGDQITIGTVQMVFHLSHSG
jgi:serine/threonine protein kinase